MLRSNGNSPGVNREEKPLTEELVNKAFKQKVLQLFLVMFNKETSISAWLQFFDPDSKLTCVDCRSCCSKSSSQHSAVLTV